jgi:hypothetical protein
VRCFILRDLYKAVVEDLAEVGYCKLCFGKVCKPAAVEVTFQMLEIRAYVNMVASPLLAIVVPSSALVSWRFSWLARPATAALLQTIWR